MSVPNPGYQGNGSSRYRRARRGINPATRRLMMFAGGLAGTLICLIGASTLTRHRSTQVPVVTADARPIRVKPDNPGGMQIDGSENDVFSVGAEDGKSRLAAVAETPDLNGMRATAVVPPPKPMVAAQGPAQAATQPPTIAPPAAERPADATATPPRRASMEPVAGVATTATPPRRANLGPVTTVAAAAPPMASVPASGASGSGRSPMVQFAALNTEQAARDEWQQLTRRMPDLLNGRRPSFSRIERDGHTLWRLRTAGFSDAAQAKAFCEHVRAKGGGCSLADF